MIPVTEIEPLGKNSFSKYCVYKQENQEHPHMREPAAQAERPSITKKPSPNFICYIKAK